VNFKEIYDAFITTEDELDLCNQKIDNIYFWERVRFGIFQEILKKKGFFGQAHHELGKFSAVKFVYLSSKNLLVNNPYTTTQSDILFFGHSRRKFREDGKWWDIYCDPILDKIKRNYVYVEFPYIDKHFNHPKTMKVKYYDFPIIFSSILRRFFIKIELSSTEKQILLQVRQHIQNALSVDINIESIVKQSLSCRKSEMPFYRALLKKIRPKLVIVVVSYGKETLIETCKQLGIPVIELQHGVINPLHLGYSFPCHNQIKHTFPDYLFTWGDFWKESTKFPISKKQVYSMGYPFLESQICKFNQKLKVNQILFLSQGTIGKELSKFAVDLNMKKDLGYKIVYKLHPGESSRWKREYPWLKDSSINVIDNDSVPLYQLFAQSKIQVGVSSTAIFEGLNFGLKTYIVNLPGVEYMDYLIRNQHANLFLQQKNLLMQ
jgi:hypothetical protein